ncbi:MAG: O-antigen ligase family protein [Planctomycetes bacterium]|nr:O-antigen ligase family protein [Planctomycetota bacterium]
MPDNPRTGPVRLLDAVAVAVLAFQIVFRLTVRTESDGWGTGLLAHLLVFLAAGSWFAARALERRMTWHLTGFEIPLAGLWILSLLSVPRAAFPLAALDGAVEIGALALLLPLAVHVFGSERRGTLPALMHSAALTLAVYGVLQYFWLIPAARESEEARRHLAAAGDLAAELAGRFRANEPSGTLFYPNTFAGFLVLTLPFALGAALDGGRRRWLQVLTVGMGGFCLWATGSKGGWIAAAVAAGAFLILAGARRFPRRRALLIGSAAVVAVAGLVAIAGPLQRIESIAVRHVYWDAGIKMTAEHPLLGVGINQFGDYYGHYKDDRQEETTHAHNDYLEVLAELGIVGLLSFIGLFLVAARKSFQAESPPPGAAFPNRTGRLLMMSIPLGLLASYAFQGIFNDIGGTPLLALFLSAVWMAAFRIIHPEPEPLRPFARIGLAAGIAGAAAHGLVDFDFYDPSFAIMFTLALAALTLSTRRGEPFTTGALAPSIAAGACFLVAIPFFAGFVPSYLSAETARAEATFLTREGNVTEAAAQWTQASQANGVDPAPYVELGLLKYRQWRAAISAGLPPGTREEERRLDLAIQPLENARKVRPRWTATHYWLAAVKEHAARTLRNSSDSSLLAEARAKAEGLLIEAERHARRAVELYPTRAHNQYLLGRVLDSAGKEPEAIAAYREALRLSELAVRVPRLALNGFQTARALVRTGGSARDAAAALAEHIDTQWLRPLEAWTPGRPLPRWPEALDPPAIPADAPPARHVLQQILGKPDAFWDDYDRRMDAVLKEAAALLQ